jgi:hypothetical protein
MVFRRSKYRRSNTKRRYTKRRGGSHKRKVYRNKHGRKSYKMRRGGGFGTKANCLTECEKINIDENPIAYNKCLKGCNSAFNPDNTQSYDEKLGNTAGDDYKTNFMDARNYTVTDNPSIEYYSNRAANDNL